MKSSRIVPASAGPAPAATPRVSLTRDEKALLEAALEQCRQTADEVQDRLTTLGRWVLQNLFGNDARAALAEGGAPRGSRVWGELLRRAGGPSLQLNRKILSVALRLASWDRLIQDERWRLLDIGRKELLLPLADEDLMREGAQHVIVMRLTQDSTRAYVQAMLQAHKGVEPAPRVSPVRVAGSLRTVRERLSERTVRRRLRQAVAEGDPGERKLLTEEIDAMMEFLRGLKKELRG